MRNFQRIAAGVDMMPIMHAVQRQPHLWDAKRYRTTFANTPHGEVNDIWLRFSDDTLTREGDPTEGVMADANCIWHPPAAALPQARGLLLDLMRRQEAYALDRVVITRLRPGARILPHADDKGAYVHDPHRERLHVVLQGLPGATFTCGTETVQMLTGEVWWFDPHQVHECFNGSADDRIHMLVDLRVMP